MPAELRQIIFSRDEITHAVARHRVGLAETAGGPAPELPPGDILQVRIDHDPTAPVHLKILPEDGSDARMVALPAEALGACLVRYCRDQGIPIPANGRKTLLAMGDSVILSLQIDTRENALADFVAVA
ncbi:MAG: hypothetical protein GVY27_10305 [Deinococcus-Thermus bacterium]|jgi:hypothetical protein|nr:hypothetical protein [Deinococcota bacterium]